MATATINITVNVSPTGPNAHMDDAEQARIANAIADVLDTQVDGAEVVVNI